MVISVILHRPHNKVNDIIMNVTLELTVELPNMGTNSSFVKLSPIFATSNTCVYDVNETKEEKQFSLFKGNKTLRNF